MTQKTFDHLRDNYGNMYGFYEQGVKLLGYPNAIEDCRKKDCLNPCHAHITPCLKCFAHADEIDLFHQPAECGQCKDIIIKSIYQ